jgi:hypothetical protein
LGVEDRIVWAKKHARPAKLTGTRLCSPKHQKNQSRRYKLHQVAPWTKLLSKSARRKEPPLHVFTSSGLDVRGAGAFSFTFIVERDTLSALRRAHWKNNGRTHCGGQAHLPAIQVSRLRLCGDEATQRDAEYREPHVLPPLNKHKHEQYN